VTAATATRFHVPATLDEALAVLRNDPTCLVASGATVVLPLLAERLDAVVVDISALPGIASITVAADHVALGPAVTYATLLRSSEPALALLRTVAGGITGGPQIRTQGTVGGSACYANPASDVPTALVAMGATMVAAGASGRREIPASDFFRSAFTTTLLPGELLIGIRVPVRQHGAWGHDKLLTAAGSWPIAVAAASLSGNEVTLTIGAVCERPFQLPRLSLENPGHLSPADETAVRAAIEEAPIAWWQDELASAEYRQRVAPVVAARAVQYAARKENL